MGTRADFYVGRTNQSEWLGSIGWDGYPEGIDDAALNATTEQEYRDAVTAFIQREDGTQPAMGWPWTWDTSATTDYAYAFDGTKVHGSCFGGAWFDPAIKPNDGDLTLTDGAPDFPNMTERRNVTFGARSGAIFFA